MDLHVSQNDLRSIAERLRGPQELADVNEINRLVRHLPDSASRTSAWKSLADACREGKSLRMYFFFRAIVNPLTVAIKNLSMVSAQFSLLKENIIIPVPAALSNHQDFRSYSNPLDDCIYHLLNFNKHENL
jgi:hypothetical protein